MKTKIFFLSILSGLVLLTSSCADFLDEDNKAGKTEKNYLTESGITGLVNACYSYTRGWYGKEPAIGLSEAGTDLWLKARDHRQTGLVEYSSLQAAASSDPEKQNSCLDEYWEMFYSALNACNTALYYVDKAEISEAMKNQYKGEASFLRAFYYWHIVETWGPVPINRTPVLTASTDVVRDSEEDIYQFMLEDVDIAIANLANKTTKTGRINLWAAKSLKARLLLYLASEYNGGKYTGGKTKAYTDAATIAQEVIAGSGASFYNNYQECWNQANEDGLNNKETIWYIDYSSNLAYNILPNRLKKDASGTPVSWTQMVLRDKSNLTGGNISHLMYTGMWNNHPKLNSGTYKVLDRTDSDAKKTINGVNVGIFFQTYSKGFCRMAPSGYLLDLFDAETDQRYQASFRDTYKIPMALAPKKDPVWFDATSWLSDTIIYLSKNRTLTASEQEKFAAKRFIMGTRTTGTTKTIKFPMYANADGSQLSITINSTGDDIFFGNNLFISLKKFDDYGTGNPIIRDISPRDFFVFRLSEMYLIKAEAELGSGTGNALATLNDLRAVRAVTGKSNSLSGTVTIQTILDERARELCGEQQRWFDLKRTGNLTSAYLTPKNKIAGENIQTYHVLRPIPQAQIDATTNIGAIGEIGKFWQNTGY